MSLYQKLIVFMLAATVVPMAVVGFALVRQSEDALRERIRAAQEEAAVAEARAAATLITEQVDDLRRAAHAFDLRGADEAALQGALRMIYQAAPDVAITLVVDDRGALQAPPVFLEDPAAIPELAEHPVREAAAVSRLQTFVPLERAVEEGVGAVVLSPPYLVAEAREVAFALALPVARQPQGNLVFAAEVSLGALVEQVQSVSALGEVIIVDREGRVVVHPQPSRLREPLALGGLVEHLPLTARASLDLWEGQERLLAAGAPVPVPGLDWTVVIVMPQARAFASVARLRWTVLGASGATVLLLLVLGGLFTRRIGRALGKVRAGAEAFGRGDLLHRIDPPSEEELHALALSFNAMGEEIHAARQKLESWNDELQAEVEARTAELRAAQARLLQAQKLAAVGQLGAGVAHEINNPLAGILGNVQLLLLKRRKAGAEEKELSTLEKMEEAARRCRAITQTLLEFSQQADGHPQPVDVGELLAAAAAASASQREEPGVEVELEVAEDLPRLQADRGQLQQALMHLLSNAQIAVGEGAGGRVRAGARREGDELVLWVADDGVGIPAADRERIFEPFFTTKRHWTSLGLGLAVTYRIVEAHGGRIEVKSEVGEGTEVSLRLPIDP
ncbi:MAG: ATP-binding protein [Deltaproteobacteria bacterium]|nr:ATP-binding protein [Deltaproteobacteria bacterium]